MILGVHFGDAALEEGGSQSKRKTAAIQSLWRSERVMEPQHVGHALLITRAREKAPKQLPLN